MISKKERMKDLRAYIKSTTAERRELLREQRRYRIELDKLKGR